MADDASALIATARERAYATPLDKFNVGDVSHFTSDTWGPWFERLRNEDPVHYCAGSEFGPYCRSPVLRTLSRWTPTTRCSPRRRSAAAS